jgi:hypothetical protein
VNCSPMGALERTMKIQRGILRALAKRITCWKVAEIVGITERPTRRWHGWYEEFGYDSLQDRRPGSAPIMAQKFSETLLRCNDF